jgi:serine protease Do
MTASICLSRLPGFLLLFLGHAALALDGPASRDGGNTTFAELLKVQQTVQNLLPRVKPAVVNIQLAGGTASGVIVSADGLIMTAAHVSEEPGKELRIYLADGKMVRAVSLGLDKTTDAALARMKDQSHPWPYVPFNRDTSQVIAGQWCVALGHPGGLDRKRGLVLRVGKIVKQTANSLQSDCVLMGGDSGGPLLNLQGEVIGIHSQIWKARDQNMHVSMAPFLRSWDLLKGSEVIKVWATGSGGYLGAATELDAQGKVAVLEVIAGSPAEKGGLKQGDFIIAVNGDRVMDQEKFAEAIRSRAAGDLVTLKVQRSNAERMLEVKLGNRPKEEDS